MHILSPFKKQVPTDLYIHLHVDQQDEGKGAKDELCTYVYMYMYIQCSSKKRQEELSTFFNKEIASYSSYSTTRATKLRLHAHKHTLKVHTISTNVTTQVLIVSTHAHSKIYPTLNLVPRHSDSNLEEGRGGTPGTHCHTHAFSFEPVIT